MPICSMVRSLLGICRRTNRIALFLENTDAKTRHVAEGKSEVGASAFANVLDVIFGGDAAHQLFGILRCEGGPSTRWRMP